MLMKHLSFKYWWHYLPIILIALVLCFFFEEPYIGLWLLLAYWWLLLGLIIWLIIVLGKSWDIGGTHKYICFGLFGLEVLALLILLLVRIPAYKCNPDKMVTHYEKKKPEIEELIAYTHSALDSGQNMYLEFQHGRVSIFNTSNYSYLNDEDYFDVNRLYVSSAQKRKLMASVGLDEREFKHIKKQLKRCKCISIDTNFPDYCNIGYKRVAFGQYSFRLYLNQMTEEQKQEALSDGHFIPYDDTMLLEFAGGAAGPDEFSSDVKKDYLEKHPYPVPEKVDSLYRKTEHKEDTVPYNLCDVKPTFQDGTLGDFSFWVVNHMDLGSVDMSDVISTSVNVRVLLAKDGQILDVVGTGNHPDSPLTKAFIKAAKDAPKWTPASKDGAPCKAVIDIPVHIDYRLPATN